MVDILDVEMKNNIVSGLRGLPQILILSEIFKISKEVDSLLDTPL